MKQKGRGINSVEKALNILMAFLEREAPWGVRELSTRLGFSPATAQRSLQTLKAYGFLDQDPETRQYRLGNIYYAFLHSLQSAFPVSRAALPYMKQLLAVTGETVHLNLIDERYRLCIDTIESPQNLKASMPIGSRSPLHAGASSKCLLAFSSQDFIENYLKSEPLNRITENTITDAQTLRAELEVIRNQGYATSLAEHNSGLGAMSAPVLNHRGVLLAALSLALPEIRFRDDRHRGHCLTELVRTTRDFSKIMGYRD